MLRTVLLSVAAEPSRILLGLLPISAAIALILVFEGFLVGLDAQLKAFPAQLPAPLVVLQNGASNFIGARSVLAQDVRKEIEAVPGVSAVHPLVALPIVFTKDGLGTPICVIGYDTLGAPRSLIAGRAINGPRELVVDAALARKYGLSPGDKVDVVSESFVVVGLSSGTTTMFSPYVFIKYDDLIDVYVSGAFESGLEPPLLSFLLVEIGSDFATGRVRTAIEASVPRVDVLTPAELSDNDVALGRRLIGPIVQVITAIAWLIGLLVVGLTSFATVQARLREYGVMKAIGAENRRLIGALVVETLLLTTCALGVGLVGAKGIALVVHHLSPQYLVIPWATRVIGRTAVVSVLIALVGALLPMRTITRVDPALVFRS